MSARAARQIFRKLHSVCWFHRLTQREERDDNSFEPNEESYERKVLSEYGELSDDAEWQLRIAIDCVRRNEPPKEIA